MRTRAPMHMRDAGAMLDQSVYTRSTIAMDTFVTVEAESNQSADTVQAALGRALDWFATVEHVCNRFDPDSELFRLCDRPRVPVRTSALLYVAVAFAATVAELTDGAFDPAVGALQQARGFTQSYRTGHKHIAAAGPGTYRDIALDRTRQTVTLQKPLLLDLGAVAKGLAIDLAARELAGLERFAVDAGGDLYCGGAIDERAGWQVGIENPGGDGLLGTVTARHVGVCTSSGVARPAPAAGGHHLLDPRSGQSPEAVAGVTVVAPTAMAADALSTAAFILGPAQGLRMLAEQDVHGMVVMSNGDVRMTDGWTEELEWSAFHV
jgi:FAD:protein FMN transferase